jgi:hypothetical protein
MIDIDLDMKFGRLRHAPSKTYKFKVGDVEYNHIISMSLSQTVNELGILTIEYNPTDDDGHPVYDKENKCFPKETATILLDAYQLTINGTEAPVFTEPS